MALEAEIFLLGRIIVGFFFIMNGINHFMEREMMEGYAQGRGVPAPGLSVLGTGVVLLLGGLSILLGFEPLIGIILLAGFLLSSMFLIHKFWEVSEEEKMNEQINFMKNMAMVGFLLMLYYIPTPWEYSI